MPLPAAVNFSPFQCPQKELLNKLFARYAKDLYNMGDHTLIDQVAQDIRNWSNNRHNDTY